MRPLCIAASALAIGMAGCKTSEPEPTDAPAPRAPAIVFNGWPGPLRPHLRPKRDLEVGLHGTIGAGAPEVTCRLPEGQPVHWTRSRVRVTRPGRRVATASTAVHGVRFGRPEGVSRRAAQAPTTDRLDVTEGSRLEVRGRVFGRCLLSPVEASSLWAAPCTAPRLRLEHPVEQSWWLEIACTSGEGWFEVDPEAFTLEHEPDEHPR